MFTAARVDPVPLRSALATIPDKAWSFPSDFRDTNVHHGYRQVSLADAGRRYDVAGPFGFVLDAFAPVFTAWLSWIDPGGFIRPHRDAGPWRERWQVPIMAGGQLRQEPLEDSWVPQDGVAFPVTHWRAHSVVNRSVRPRIHLVIDRDVLLDLPAARFRTYPIPDDMADLIEAVERSLPDGTSR